MINQTVAKSERRIVEGIDQAEIRQPEPRTEQARVLAWAYSDSAVGKGRSMGSCASEVVEGRGVLGAA